MTESASFTGREAFRAAVLGTFAEACADGWGRLVLCDPDFSQWPLGDREAVESLTRWAGAGRRMTVLALHFDEVARRHPRWVQWRRQWAHVVECRALQEITAPDVPVLIHAPDRLSLRLFDPLRYRGVVSSLASDVLQTRELIDAITQRSVEAFPATTLGL